MSPFLSHIIPFADAFEFGFLVLLGGEGSLHGDVLVFVMFVAKNSGMRGKKSMTSAVLLTTFWREVDWS